VRSISNLISVAVADVRMPCDEREVETRLGAVDAEQSCLSDSEREADGQSLYVSHTLGITSGIIAISHCFTSSFGTTIELHSQKELGVWHIPFESVGGRMHNGGKSQTEYFCELPKSEIPRVQTLRRN